MKTRHAYRPQMSAPQPGARPERPPRCCARCKTPYNCGRTECPCHQPKEPPS